MKLNNFIVQEFVPEAIYRRRGDRAIELLDARIVAAADRLRTNIGRPFTINNWHLGGARQQSGLRTRESTSFSETSQHTFGRALDVLCAVPVKDIHAHIINNQSLYPEITFIEIDIGWLHIDCRANSDGSPLRLWSPTRGFVDVDAYRVEVGE